MTEINKFVALFHSIQGSTLKEKRKNFNEFLRLLKTNITVEDDLNNLILLITPKTPFEETFKIEIMIEFKQKELLLQELKGGNRIIIKKLLKDWRLFGEIFSAITSDELINNILPYLPYSLRLKLLNGISKNVTNANHLDNYFLALEKKYGMDSAAVLLPGCSVDLIKSTIEKYHLKMPESHLKRIFKKDMEFVHFYFDVIKQKHGNMNFTSTYPVALKYIARINPEFYWNLHEKYKINLKFGKYLTPKMIKSHKNIVDEGLQAFNIFHNSKMYKTMLKEKKLDKFLLNLYPETHDKFVQTVLNYRILKFIRKGPISKQYHILSTQFNRKYSSELLKYPDYFTQDLLKITPLKERESILDKKVKDDESLYYLYGTNISVPKYKQHMQHSSKSQSRFEYAAVILQTCLVNNDQPALLEVLHLLINRYKNDTHFLRSFFERCFQDPECLRKLSMEHWECLATMQKIFEHSNIYVWQSCRFYEMYLEQLLAYNQPVDDTVKDSVKRMVDNKSSNFIMMKEKKFQKTYCDKLAVCIDEYKGHEKYQYLCCQFLNFASQNCNLKLFEYERFFDQLKPEEWVSAIVIKSQVKLDNEIIHDLFWKLDRNGTNETLMWYAKNRPDILRKNVDKIWGLIESYRIQNFFSDFKRFCGESILQTIKECAVDVINSEKTEKIQEAIAILSVISPETFLELIPAAFPPEDGKIDIEESAEKIKVRRAFVDGLRNIHDPEVTFPLVLKFCVADYLKFALSSLYGISYDTSELLIQDYLKGLSNPAMSVRKHILLLARHLFPLQDFITLLKSWSEKEKNASLRNILLKKTVQCFVENPLDELWTLLKYNLKSIDSEDREIFDFVLKFEKIPRRHLPEYLEIIYETISQNPDVKIIEKKFELIRNIPTELIDKLSLDFLKKLIKDTVCGVSSSNFHWKCVFHVNAEKQSELFEENFVHLKHYVEKHGTENPKTRGNISSFLTNFLYLAVEFKHGGELINHFMSSWSSIFPPETFGKEFLLVEFYDLSVKSDFEPYETGIKINQLLYHYIDKYNSSVIDSFCKQLRCFSNWTSIQYKQEDTYRFVDGFFHNKRDENIYIAVMYFLPKTYPTVDSAYAKYLPIFEAVASSQSPAVQYHFDYYLCGQL